MKQWRITLKYPNGSGRVVFIDAKDEQGARDFAAKVFPRAEITEAKLEPVDPCAQYERRTP